MKKIECTFYRPEHVNTREFMEIVKKLESDFYMLCNDDVPEELVCTYAEALIALARPLEYNPKMYFLGLDDPNRMPSDARVDFFYMPTYLGSAIIMKAVIKHPDLLKEHESIIQGLLRGCTGRKFSGHGYGGLKGLIETLKIFTMADCIGFIETYPEVCTEFTKLFMRSMIQIKSRLDKGELRNGWGEDYTEMAKEVLVMSGQI